MASGFFTANLAVFAVITTAATLGQSYLRQQRKAAAAAAASPASASTALGNAADTLSVGDSVPQPGGRRASLQHAGQQSGSTRSLWRAYIVVYALVMGADWLQGPYMYPLYSSLYEFTDRTVAALFVFGFSAGGISAPYVGRWADKYGRKRMCLTFCGLYATSCFIVLFRNLPLLLLGRVFGGISTSILFSCFEAWLISTAHDMAIPDAELSAILSRCTFVNGIVAAVSGVFSNILVDWSGTVKAPFLASAVCLILAGLAINSTWTENYGGQSSHSANGNGSALKSIRGDQTKKVGNVEASQPLMLGGPGNAMPTIDEEDSILESRAAPLVQPSALRTIFSDPSLLTLGITQTFYETAMYLFVFLWVPALQVVSYSEEDLPFGIIFSAFMCCMSLGAVIYGIASESPGSAIHRHASLASITCLVAAGALITSAMSKGIFVRFWAFCVFEATVGMYFPILGTLRGALIPDETRASFSALFRVPLNVLVTISLLTGAEEHKDLVIFASVAMLALGSLAMVLGIRRRVQ